ncbi:MAG: DUF11 domain-containing protein, partial [Aestuariibacter sp.]|nr:DUF11 domain-containing protein [Aestuariibacter sp.]
INQITDDADVNLIEPVLTIDKSLVVPIPSPLDAGTVITYQVVLQHDGTSNSDAYDVVITDTLPSELNNGTLVSVTASGIAAPTGDLTADVLRVPNVGTFDLPQGAIVTATFMAEIGGTAVPGQPITNNAGAVWTTLDNSPPEERHGGGTDPDGSDFLDDGAVDDYEIEDPADFTVDAPTFTKALQTTSASHTSGSNVTIGEIVTYSMTVTLSEGTIPSLQVIDDLPAGMAFVSGSDSIDDSGFNGTIPAYTLTAPGTNGANVTFDWTSFTVPADNDPSNDSFIIEIQAVVLDVGSNVGLNPPGQTVLTNTASVQVGSGTPTTSNPVDVTVVEPQLEIVKSFSTFEASPNETVTVTLTITNTGTSTAFDVIIEDPLPVLTYTNVTEGSTPAGFTYSLVPSGSDNIVTYNGGSIPVGGNATFTFEVTLHPTLLPSPPDLLNVATVTQNTTLDSTTPDGDDTQERDEPDVNDDAPLTVIIPDLVLTKTNVVTYVSAGDLITYTINVENVGGADATGVVVTDTVPANTTFDLANSTATWAGCADNAAAGTDCVFTIGNLASGANTTIQFAVEVDDPLPNLTANITNAAITGDDGTKGIDPTPPNNDDDEQDTVTATIGDYVWEDMDADGTQNDGNTGINGVTVRLYRDIDGDGIAEPGGDDGAPISTTLTINDGGGNPGYYLFDRLIPDDYFVEFVKPAGYEESPRDQGGDAADSDPNILTGVTIVTTLTAGEIDLTWDAGFFRPVSIGSFVWEDQNNDGTQGATEPGIAGATVELLVDNGGSFVTAVDTDNVNIPDQTTGADGLYHFTNLPPGDYRVRVTPPANYIPSDTQTSVDDDNTESDSNIASEPVAGTHESGTFTLTIDGEPTESVTYDGDAQDDSTELNGNMTVDFGFFQPLSIGSFIWVDQDGDGIQDAIEPGIGGVTVTLWVDNGSSFVPAVDITGSPVLTQTTGADGLYDFTNLPPGDYRVQVTPPPTYLASLTQNTADNDDTENDSNIADEPVAGTHESGTFTLVSSGEPTESGTYDGDGQDDSRDNDGNMTVDFGFIEPVSIGSYVWEDLDGDGIQEGTEPAIAGATVSLLVDNGGSFVAATDVDGGLVANQITGADGLYNFTDLPPGDYRVRVVPPANHWPSSQQTTANNDNSVNDSNIADEPVAGTYESGTFTLTVDGELTEVGSFDGDDQDDTADNDGNMSVDFGFVQPVSIGSFVWTDLDVDGVQDVGETPITGALVSLLVDDGTGTFVAAVDVDGVLVSDQTTLADGLYHFINLPPGEYRVRVTPPAEYVPTMTQTTADDDDTESDSNIATQPVAGTYQSGTFALIRGSEPTESGTYAGDAQDNADEAEGNMTIDFGFIKPMEIGSFVWEDLNFDGDQDGGEPGVNGATVELLVDNGGSFVPAVDVTGTAVLTQTTGADGLYHFTNLPPGDYRVQVTPPASFVPTDAQTTADDDDTENDSNIANEPVAGTYESGTFTLAIDSEPTETNTYDGDNQDSSNNINGNMTVDIGFFQPLSIGSYVWVDQNGDGVQDGTEPGVITATVELLVDNGGSFVPAVDVTGTAVPTQTTGTDGLYNFINLPPGDYRVQVTPPSSYIPTSTQTTANNDDTVSDSNIADEPVAGTYESGTFTLTSNGEPTEAGSYDGDTQDDSRDTDGNMTVDFGFIETLSIGSFVWEDQNGDGLQDVTEPGITGATVELLVDNGSGFVAATDVNGTAVISQTTGADGLYNFINLPPGDYRVQVTPPPAYSPTPDQTLGDNDTATDSNIASEPSSGTYESGTFTLTVDGEPVENGSLDGDAQDDARDNDGNMTVDFGFILPVSIGSFVWSDIDGDGLQGGTEPGIENAEVTLWLDSGSGFVAAVDVDGTAVLSQTTSTDGLYHFTNLPPGDYRVQVTPPTGSYPSLTQTTADNDDAENDSNIASEPVAGTYESGTFTLVGDGEPTESGSYDGDLQDAADNDNGNMTVDFGFVQAVSIGSYVWEDQNDDGTQDGTEPGIAGADVTLWVDNGGSFVPAVTVTGTAVLTQTTGADGLYNFINLPPGDYRVQVTPPATFEPSSVQTTADNNDTVSDSNIADEPVAGTYESGTFTLTIGGEPTEAGTFDGDTQDTSAETNGNMTVDFGFFEPVSIGSYIWTDTDGDGIQDGTEPAITGADVTLWVDNGSGFVAAVDVNGTAVISQTTGADGLYNFINLPPGDYRVQVTPPAGMVPTVVQTTASNDDSEDDSNIANDLGGGVYESATFTLASSGEPTESITYDGDNQDDSRDNDGNMTVDFGFIEPVSLGSFVWEDYNGDGQQDGGEPGISGATVELFVDSGSGFVAATDVNGTAVISQTTGADGLYNFTSLPPGDYRVQVTPPAGYSPSLTQTSADDDNTESDSNIASDLGGGVYESGTFTLTVNGEPTESITYDGDNQDNSSENNGNMTVDFAFIQAVSIGSFVWEDEDSDGLQDIGEPGIAGATLALFFDGGSGFVPATDVMGTAVPTQTTTTSGEYHFTNLPPGDYRVQVTPPTDYTPTPTQNGADDDDSELDSNIATEPVAGTFESGTFTLNLSGEPIETGLFVGDDQDNVAETDGNMTVDFGFVPVVTLGSFVWIDQDGDGLQ